MSDLCSKTTLESSRYVPLNIYEVLDSDIKWGWNNKTYRNKNDATISIRYLFLSKKCDCVYLVSKSGVLKNMYFNMRNISYKQKNKNNIINLNIIEDIDENYDIYIMGPICYYSISKVSNDIYEEIKYSKSKKIDIFPTEENGIEPSNSESLCIICSTYKKNTTIIPCGHVTACVNCSRKLKESMKCPICRGVIEKVIKIY